MKEFEAVQRTQRSGGLLDASFFGKILKECLDLPQGIELGIERLHGSSEELKRNSPVNTNTF